jgi:hypothetical protein
MSKLFNFDPEKPLFSQLGFLLALLLPIGISICLIISLVVVEDLCLKWSVEGFANFLTIFALPIGVASLSIPLVAVCASQHRSVQSAAQIKATQSQIQAANSQNLLTNYYKHLEEFKKYIEDEVNKEEIGIKFSYRKLHKVVYKELKSGVDRPAQFFLSNLASQLTINADHLENAEKLKDFERLFVTSHWEAVALSLGNFFDIYGLAIDLKTWPNTDEFDLKPSALLISEIGAGYRALDKLLHHCFEFSQVSTTEYTKLLDPQIEGLAKFEALGSIYKDCVSLSAKIANLGCSINSSGDLFIPKGSRLFINQRELSEEMKKVNSALSALSNPVNTMLTHHKKIDNKVLSALLENKHISLESGV